MRILILNGSIHGNSGNCGVLIQKICRRHPEIDWDIVDLTKSAYGPGMRRKIQKAEAFLFLSGTYWDSWGSPLQKFLEEATELEATAEVLGKPAGVCILMHSVGGKEVLSRLQGVLSSFGFLLPPLSGMAYSLSGQLAMGTKSAHADDFWALDDIEVVLSNLQAAQKMEAPWKAWPVDRKNFRRKWVSSGKPPPKV